MPPPNVNAKPKMELENSDNPTIASKSEMTKMGMTKKFLIFFAKPDVRLTDECITF